MPAKTTKPVPESASENGKNPVVSGVHSALRASIGLLALGKDEVEAIVDRMVERGELAEKDGRKILGGLFGRPQKHVRQMNAKVESTLDEGMLAILKMLNAPTQADLQELSQKIRELTERVEQLSERVSS